MSRINKAIFSGIFILFLMNVLPGSSSITEKADMKVLILGVNENIGFVNVALCADKEQFRDKVTPFRWAKVKAVSGGVSVVFEDVPSATYAIKVYHDKDADGELDTALFGRPTEAYGFSNDPKKGMGMPPYKKVKFEHGKDTGVITIKVD